MKIRLFIVLLLLPMICFARDMPLNQISLQLFAEKWATTTTANVTVSVDASLNKVGLANAQKKIMQQLNKITNNVDWHVVVFDRSQDQSGLEKLRVQAQARIPENQLVNLRDQAKSISHAGETYRIVDIDFSPSQQELAQTRAEARAKIYTKTKQEIAVLNKTFPGMHYFLHSINFGRMIMPRAQTKMLRSAAVPQPAAMSTVMSVSAKVVENAKVVIASSVFRKSKN